MKSGVVIPAILAFLFFSGSPLSGQPENRRPRAVSAPGELATLFPSPEEPREAHAEPLRESTHDIHILASAGFYVYKNLISSQDKPSCVFTPSCSEYALESVRNKGLLTGWVKTFDRLCRCHGLVHPEHYPFDMESQRYHDPVR